jgi:YD repeat-containing protein
MRLTQLQVKDPGQTEALNYQYAYDKADNITQKATEHGTYSYAYDSLYRLIQAQNPSPLVNEACGYDALGNRTSDRNVAGAWQYNANNQLTQAGNIAFVYDDNGNVVTKTGLRAVCWRP